MQKLAIRSVDLAELRPQLAEAQAKCDELIAAEKAISDNLHNLCVRLWELGRLLALLKDAVGHGKWMFYVAANFPQLGIEESSRCRRVADAIVFFKMNPKFADTGEFAVESIRKCVFRIAPDKERPELEGDAKIEPSKNHLGFVNKVTGFATRWREGLVRVPNEELKEDFRPLKEFVDELYAE